MPSPRLHCRAGRLRQTSLLVSPQPAFPGRLPLTTPSCSAAGDARPRSTPELAATGKSVAYEVVVEKLEMSAVLGALEDAERRRSALGETAMDGGFR